MFTNGEEQITNARISLFIFIFDFLKKSAFQALQILFIFLLILKFHHQSSFASESPNIEENAKQQLIDIITKMATQSKIQPQEIPSNIIQFLAFSFIPVVGDRSQFASYKLKKNENKWTLEISTFGFRDEPLRFQNQNPVRSENDDRLAFCYYKIHFCKQGTGECQNGKTIGLPSLRKSLKRSDSSEPDSSLQINGDLTLALDDDHFRNPNHSWLKIQHQLRSLFRADPYLHPYSPLNYQSEIIRTKKFKLKETLPNDLVLSDIQSTAISQLLILDQSIVPRNLSVSTPGNQTKDFNGYLGLLMPVGTGKTLVSIYFLDQLKKLNRLSNHSKIVLIYENTTALKQFCNFFKKYWNLNDSDFVKWFEDNPREELISSKPFKILLATRSSYYNHMKETHEYISNSGSETSWYFIFDEAHHVGRSEGQFDQIINGSGSIPGLNTLLDHNDRALFMTATPWHPDTNILKILHGRLAAPLLTEEEITRLRDHRTETTEIMQISRRQLLRSMSQGYLSPVEKYIRYLSDQDQEKLISVLNESTTKLASISNDDSRKQYLIKTIHIYEEIINHIGQSIIANRIPLQNDLGLIYVPTIIHANIYTDLLNRWFKKNRIKRSAAQVFHSQLNAKQRDKIENWFISEGNTYQNKYLIVVDSFREAVDITKLNLIINARSIQELKTIIQIIGRAARIELGKTGMRVIDLTGDFQSFLKPDLPDTYFMIQNEIEHPSANSDDRVRNVEKNVNIKPELQINDIKSEDNTTNWHRGLMYLEDSQDFKKVRVPPTSNNMTLLKILGRLSYTETDDRSFDNDMLLLLSEWNKLPGHDKSIFSDPEEQEYLKGQKRPLIPLINELSTLIARKIDQPRNVQGKIRRVVYDLYLQSLYNLNFGGDPKELVQVINALVTFAYSEFFHRNIKLVTHSAEEGTWLYKNIISNTIQGLLKFNIDYIPSIYLNEDDQKIIRLIPNLKLYLSPEWETTTTRFRRTDDLIASSEIFAEFIAILKQSELPFETLKKWAVLLSQNEFQFKKQFIFNNIANTTPNSFQITVFYLMLTNVGGWSDEIREHTFRHRLLHYPKFRSVNVNPILKPGSLEQILNYVHPTTGNMIPINIVLGPAFISEIKKEFNNNPNNVEHVFLAAASSARVQPMDLIPIFEYLLKPQPPSSLQKENQFPIYQLFFRVMEARPDWVKYSQGVLSKMNGPIVKKNLIPGKAPYRKLLNNLLPSMLNYLSAAAQSGLEIPNYLLEEIGDQFITTQTQANTLAYYRQKNRETINQCNNLFGRD